MTPIKIIFRNRNLIVLGFSWSVSRFGSWITMMAVFAMVVFRGEGGVAQSSGIFLSGLLPVLILSPLAGWLCDRYDRKRLMIASELLAGLAVMGLVFTEQLWMMYTLLALQSAATTIMEPARQAVTPMLVAEEDLTQANAFMQQLNGGIKIFAPVLAGFLLTLMTPHMAILLDVVSYALSAVILNRLPSLKPERLPGIEPEVKHGVSTSQNGQSVWAVLRDIPRLRLLFLSIFLAIFIIIGYDILCSIFIRDIFGLGERFFGMMIGLIGLGTLGGALWLMFRKGESDRWRDIVVGLLLASCIPLSPALVSITGSKELGIGLMALGNLLGGFGSGLILVQVNTLLQVLSPPTAVGRVAGAFESTATAGQLAGMLLTPLLVPGLISMGTYFFGSVAAILLLVGYVVFMLNRQTPRPQLSDSVGI
jgi:MFS transporter, DHA3 family, macrolide efflux protein